MKKLIYEDNGTSYMLIGSVTQEDDHFLIFNDRKKGEVRIGKRFIIKIEEVD